MAYKSNNPLFRDLTDEEETEFREYARQNPPSYQSDDKKPCFNSAINHPVCCEEWTKQGFFDLNSEEGFTDPNFDLADIFLGLSPEDLPEDLK